MIGQQGPPGPPGTAANIAVGTTSTGTPGTNATVTNSGTASAAIFNFTIPAGAQGIPGPPGTGLAIGSVLKGIITCPIGVGTIGQGFTSPKDTTQACTFTVTGIQ